ncbi:MAG: hypothetical protein GX638_05520 [Crenarchaeota archaeon]|nr:hypothetical protein [Thermoproteota archaeon]
MKASELIKQLETLMNQYGDLDLVYAIDDEGNDFKLVYFDASVGNYNEENREFHSLGVSNKINAICIN